MTHLCEIHRAYNCHHETCKLLARSGEVLGKEASDDLEGFDDLLPQAEPATVLTLRPEPQPAKVAPVAAPVAAVPAPAKLTLKQPPAKPVATPLPALNVKNPQTSQPVTAVAVKPDRYSRDDDRDMALGRSLDADAELLRLQRRARRQFLAGQPCGKAQQVLDPRRGSSLATQRGFLGQGRGQPLGCATRESRRPGGQGPSISGLT